MTVLFPEESARRLISDTLDSVGVNDLLAKIGKMSESYDLKVEDFARETRRTSELAIELQKAAWALEQVARMGTELLALPGVNGTVAMVAEALEKCCTMARDAAVKTLDEALND